MEDTVSTFGFKSAVLLVTTRYPGHSPTEFKYIILYHPYITQIMVKSHCEIMWADNPGAYFRCHPTANYSEGIDDVEKQAIISQNRLRSNMLDIWFKSSLTTYANFKLWAFKSA